MSPLLMVTIAAVVLTVLALLRAVYVMVHVGLDSHEVGPWRRPEPDRRPTRLPSDFIGLWSLFGEKSIRTYAGSWEAAVRRLDEMEEQMTQPRRARSSNGQVPDAGPVPDEYSEDWLHARLDRLEQLAGFHRPDPTDGPADGPTDSTADA